MTNALSSKTKLNKKEENQSQESQEAFDTTIKIHEIFIYPVKEKVLRKFFYYELRDSKGTFIDRTDVLKINGGVFLDIVRKRLKKITRLYPGFSFKDDHPMFCTNLSYDSVTHTVSGVVDTKEKRETLKKHKRQQKKQKEDKNIKEKR